MNTLSQRPAPLSSAHPSPSDRFLSRRRTTLLRDWILALIALGLILAASVFRSELSSPTHEPSPVAPAAAQHI